MKLKNIILAICAAGAMVSVPASAGVLGAADLSILSLGIVTPAGLPVLGTTPSSASITILGDQRTGAAGADFNGVSAIGVGNGTITMNGGVDVDVKYRCAGPDCAAAAALYTGPQAVGTVDPQPENNLTTHIMIPTLNFALGDMAVVGTAVSGPGANGLTRADSSVAGPTNIGGSNGSINNNVSARSTTQFTVLNPDSSTSTTGTLTAKFALTYDVFRRVFIDPTNPITTSGIASAGTSFILQLTSSDPTFVPLVWMPGALNGTFSAFSSADNQTFSDANTIFSDTRTLVAGQIYNLSIIQSSLSTASQVPEPAACC